MHAILVIIVHGIEATMKAITYQKSSDTFSVSELPTPNLESEFDVLVKVVAVALNPVDAKINFLTKICSESGRHGSDLAHIQDFINLTMSPTRL